MKFIHLSDLHLGKRVGEFSMIEDQKYILKQIIEHICDEKPDGVLIAGDVYDRSVPSTEAVGLLGDFLAKLAMEKIPTFLISGNHDSAERLCFAHEILEHSKIYISPTYRGAVKPITLEKEGESVDIYLLPFVKPIQVSKYHQDITISSYTDAVSHAIKEMKVNPERTNILVTHQFVTGGAVSDSEEHSVGGSDNVDRHVFAEFDYVALGHLHAPQKVGEAHTRYCGTPLKYSFSEVHHKKSVTVVEIGESIEIRTLPLIPLRDMIDVKGTYLEVTAIEFYEKLDQNAYFRVTLLDEDDVLDGVARLRKIYPNLMQLRYDNKRTRHKSAENGVELQSQTNPIELFESLYQDQNGSGLTEEQREYLQKTITSIWEERT
ncbi:MAG: exonuclease SbcCD subunit D [Eubacteriales bacterium]